MSNDNPVNTKLPSYEVHSAAAEKALRGVGGMLKEAMPPGYGFCLMIFDYTRDETQPGNMFYLCSARREDMIKMLREFIVKMGGKP